MADATLDAARGDGATTGDGEDVLDGHEERLVGLAGGSRDVLVDSVHELPDGILIALVALEGLEGGAADDGDIIAGEVVLGEQVAGLHLDEVDELLVINHVALVEEDDDVGNADLAGEQDVLAGLGHRAVGGGDNEDGAVHLSSTRDHVLDVVSMARAVDVSVVTLVGLVLDVGDGNRDAALALFRSLVDILECGEVGGGGAMRTVIVGKRLGDSRGKRGLAMVDVTNGADVYMRLGAVKLFLFSHHILLFADCMRVPALGYASLPNYYFIRAEPRSEAKKLVAAIGFEPMATRV